MTRQEFIDWATGRGWKLDRWNHLQWQANDGQLYRYKLSRIAVRYEIRLSGNAGGWVRIRSGYFSRLSIDAQGKLTGMKR